MTTGAEGAKVMAARPPATPRPSAPAAGSRGAAVHAAARAALARAAWSVSRTGRPGLAGIGLLLAAALFRVSTHLQVSSEVDALRRELAEARAPALGAAPARGVAPSAPAAAARALPARAEVPAILRELFSRAVQARLAIDSGRYELRAASTSGRVVRTQVVFPVTGPYPQIRAFIDATLATMPSVAVSELSLARRSIAGGNVEARIALTVFTTPAGADAGAAAGAPPGETEARLAAARAVAPVHAAALFAQHSWFVPRPPPPPPPEPPPPEPTAPPLPYTFVGTYAPGGEAPVYFLASGDRVIDTHVGDKLDGIYQFESAAGGTLTFVYLPLNVRQTLAAGVPK